MEGDIPRDVKEEDAVIARPSATIVVLREGPQAPEILMVKRRAGDAFGDSYAFPGGVIDADESRAQSQGMGLSSDAANTLLSVDDNGLDYFCAAIRELFEETGVLLAKETSGCWSGCDDRIETLRRKVDDGSLPWSEFLQQQSLAMAFDALHYFCYWQTPLWRPKRWTTRFFAAEMPAGQNACHDGSELTDSRWLQSKDALALNESGEIELPQPTTQTLLSIREMTSIAEIFAWAKGQQATGIPMLRIGNEERLRHP